MSDSVEFRPESTLESGTPVEVRERFKGLWARGFTVADTSGGGYHLRRESDGAVLPAWFPRQEVRAAQQR